MIIFGGIEFYPKGCARWIIVMELRVLLIMPYLIQEILMDAILDVHVKGVNIKSSSIQMLL
jgi:hypothetical protein